MDPSHPWKNSRPTILFVASPAPLGGSNVSLATLLAEISGKIHRIVAAPPGPFSNLVESLNLAEELIELPGRGSSPIGGRLRQMVWLAGWMARRRKQVDLIHANATSGLRVAALAVLLWKRPVVCWIHDATTTNLRMRLGPALRFAARNVRWAAVSETALEVAVTSRLCRRELVSLIPNPIDPATVLRSLRSPRQGPLSVCYLGRASKRKGFDILPDVIERLPADGHRWLLFTNQIPDPWAAPIWDRIRNFPKERVSVLGSQSDVREAYGVCDIVFVPSREESFGRIVAEAMLNGIPVVGSDIRPFIEQLGTEEAAGLVFRLDDPADAANEINRLLSDKCLRLRLGEVGRVRAARYSPAAVADQMLEFYGFGDPRSEV